MMFSGSVYQVSVAIVMLVSAIVSLPAYKKESKESVIVISNNENFDRMNETVIVNKISLGDIDGRLSPSVTDNSQKVLITQQIDQDNDGAWDELLIEVSMKAHGTDTLQLHLANKANRQVFAKTTNVRLSVRSDTDHPAADITSDRHARGFAQNIAKPFYQMEGPGIENNKVAFRAFFDYRNGKDVFGKIQATPVLEKVGVGESWHELRKWGMDVLHTGNSLGAGALAVEEDTTIFRLGDADTSCFKYLYEGALKASFILSFKNWDVAREKKNGSETISITKGNFYYRNDIDVALKTEQHLVSGIANFGPYPLVYKKYNNAFSSVSTYGKQAEGTLTKLGLSIMFPSADYVSSVTTGTASSIPNTSYVALKPSQNGRKTIYFFACWEKSDIRFATQAGFEKYLQRTSEELAHPLKVKVISRK